MTKKKRQEENDRAEESDERPEDTAEEGNRCAAVAQAGYASGAIPGRAIDAGGGRRGQEGTSAAGEISVCDGNIFPV